MSTIWSSVCLIVPAISLSLGGCAIVPAGVNGAGAQSGWKDHRLFNQPTEADRLMVHGEI
jgi:hypothetical protein